MTRPPRTIEQATALLAHYAEVDTQLAETEANRKAELGRINAAADAVAAPLIAELQAISTRLKPWWQDSGKSVAPKGRKSAQLGGCMIGSRMSKATLGHGFKDDAEAVEALRATRYGKHTTSVKYSLDRAAALKLLQVGGKTATAIKELGFSVVEPTEQFFIQRVEQPGTING